MQWPSLSGPGTLHAQALAHWWLICPSRAGGGSRRGACPAVQTYSGSGGSPKGMLPSLMTFTYFVSRFMDFAGKEMAAVQLQKRACSSCPGRSPDSVTPRVGGGAAHTCGDACCPGGSGEQSLSCPTGTPAAVLGIEGGGECWWTVLLPPPPAPALTPALLPPTPNQGPRVPTRQLLPVLLQQILIMHFHSLSSHQM